MKKINANILVVDDNEEILFSLEIFLGKYFENVKTERNPERLPSIISKTSFDIVILDMNFTASQNTGNEGFFWMKKILENDPQTIIIFITAYPEIELAVRAIKEGAADFIEKPWDNGKILTTVINAFKLRQSKLEISRLEGKHMYLIDNIDKSFRIIQGPSQVMRDVYSTVDKVADTDANILILGENGTGKELIAREIHRKSKRSSETFVSVDLASLSENLFESELFGHVKGAFTDAKSNRIGRFEVASGGTLFLDEIANLSMTMQAKLLTVLQNRVIIPIGTNTEQTIDIRLICASNKDLDELVTNNLFREDLLYRINTVQIDLPPLRKRVADIAILIDHFLKEFRVKYDKSGLKISDKTIEKLSLLKWPGNIRQLRHTIENAVILSEKSIIGGDDFSRIFSRSNLSFNMDNVNYYENEKSLIQKALANNKGHLTRTANELGIARTTLYRKIKKYDLSSF